MTPTGAALPLPLVALGVAFDQNDLRIQLGDILLMEHGQPLSFDRSAASAYLKTATQGDYLKTDTVAIQVSIGDGAVTGQAWGCDLSYDYVKIMRSTPRKKSP
jgi:glutamate N-acetyltransferase/amino-acid N-acetyltransferase